MPASPRRSSTRLSRTGIHNQLTPVKSTINPAVCRLRNDVRTWTASSKMAPLATRTRPVLVRSAAFAASSAGAGAPTLAAAMVTGRFPARSALVTEACRMRAVLARAAGRPRARCVFTRTACPRMRRRNVGWRFRRRDSGSSAGGAYWPRLDVLHVEYFHDHQRIANMLFDGALRPVGGTLTADPGRPGGWVHGCLLGDGPGWVAGMNPAGWRELVSDHPAPIS